MPKPPHAKELAREHAAKAWMNVRMALEDGSLAREHAAKARMNVRMALEDGSLAREYQKMAREHAMAARKYGTEDLEDEKRLGDYLAEEHREYSMGWEFMLVEDD